MAARNVLQQRGFTLPELLVVGVLFLLAIGILLVVLRPANYGPEHRNAQRRLDLVVLMKAIVAYKTAAGSLPPSITDHDKIIATAGTGPSLCDDLVPLFLADIPLDPVKGERLDNAVCSADGQMYTSGYTVRVKGGQVVLNAPAAKSGETISLEHWFPIL